MSATFSRGDVVTVMWKGRPPTGASFIPVFMDDDGQEYNVDTRVVLLGYHGE